MDEGPIKPTLFLGRVFHGQRIGRCILAAYEDAIQQTQHDQDDNCRIAPCVVTGQRGDHQGYDGEAGNRDQRCPTPAQPIPKVAEDNRSEGPADQRDRKDHIEDGRLRRPAEVTGDEVDERRSKHGDR